MGNSSKILMLSAALATSLMAADQQSTNASPNIPIKNPGNNVNKLLLEAVNKDSLPDVKAIVQQNAKQLDKYTFIDALSNAATTGKQAILEWFMSEDNPIKPDQNTVNLIFMLAAEIGNQAMVEWFLKNSPRKPDPNGIYRAFASAAKAGKIAILQYLMLNAPKGSISQNAVNKVFIESAGAGDQATVYWFLTRSPIKPDQNAVNTAFINAFEAGNRSITFLMTANNLLRLKPDQATMSKMFKLYYEEKERTHNKQ
mgnify:CR=1 FL=1